MLNEIKYFKKSQTSFASPVEFSEMVEIVNSNNKNNIKEKRKEGKKRRNEKARKRQSQLQLCLIIFLKGMIISFFFFLKCIN